VVVVAKLSYLEIATFQPLLVKFISKTVKDRRNPPIYYRKLSTQSIQQQQKTFQNWMKNKNYIYLSNM